MRGACTPRLASVDEMRSPTPRTALGKTNGIVVPGDPWVGVQHIARSMPAQLSSTAQDLARHKLSEIDHLNGYVVGRGKALDIPTPVNRVLHTLVKLLESK